jgi:ABC-2 type transport system permease protein
VVVALINAALPVLGPDTNEPTDLFERKGDLVKTTSLMARIADRLKALQRYLDPPLVTFDQDRSKDLKGAAGPRFNLFGYLLVGLSAMFLLFLAGHGMTDLNAESQMRTFNRYYTVRHTLLAFVWGKIALSIIMLLFGSLIMIGGGSLIFRLRWTDPVGIVPVVLAYAWFAAGLMAVITALIPRERSANAIANIISMALGLAGGCVFPLDVMPAILRYHIALRLPTYWFVQAVRGLQGIGPGIWWPAAAIGLFAVGLALTMAAAFTFRLRFRLKCSV